MKKKTLLLAILAFVVLPAAAEKVAAFPEIDKADQLVMDKDFIYVVEKVTIYSYSRRDFKLVNKFGREGQGPQEFSTFVTISPQKDHLLINSLGKLSYFSKEGTFQKELKYKGGTGTGLFQPIGKGFVGLGFGGDQNSFFITANLYDDQLNKGKELLRMPPQKVGRLEVFNMSPEFQVYKNRIFLSDLQTIAISVLDDLGNHVFKIEKKHEAQTFGQEDERRIREFLKKQAGQAYETIKSWLVFPKYYPAIQAFFVDQDKLIVLTWKSDKSGKYTCMVMDLQGNILKQTTVTFVLQDSMRPYPYSFSDGKLYQLIDNEETEQWELHQSQIK